MDAYPSMCACWHSKTHFFVQYNSFSLFSLFSLSNHDSHAPFHPSLQVLPSFTGRGSTSHISSWYRALTKDTKALVHTTNFKLVSRLLPEGSASSIVVQKIVERWWDTTHTFHIADRKIMVTPHDFHWMTGLRFDGPLIDLKGESGI